jgi:SnoaL-like domain
VRRAALIALAGVACGHRGPVETRRAVGDPFSGESSDETPVLRRELEAEVLESYERDDSQAGDDWQTAVDPALGIVHFGAGPADQVVTTHGTPPPHLLPLGLHPGADDVRNPACPENLRSKHLEIHLSQDAGTAWIADELSACVSVCGKQALIPLRLSAVYVRGGERWVLAAEHLSYPQTAAALIARGEASARPLDPSISARQYGLILRDDVAQAVVATVKADRDRLFATTPDALAWWPDLAHELRGPSITSGPSLTDAFDAASITPENARIGIGPTNGGGAGTIAWWSGTILIRARRAAVGSAAPDVPVRLRATFVLEREADQWRIVQSHVSAPIEDAVLATQIAGGATMVDGRVSLPCEGGHGGARTAADGAAATAPAAARR